MRQMQWAAMVLVCAVTNVGCPSTSTPVDGGSDLVEDAGIDAGAPAPVTTEEVTLTTSDGLDLHATFTTGGAAVDGSPALLLLHQYLEDDGQWRALPHDWADAGFHVLALTYRGHGDSDAYDAPLANLLTDPQGAPVDVDAGLAWLLARDDVDVERIGIVGTSIGANLAVASSIHDLASTYVALSPRLPPSESLAASPATGMSSVFFVSSRDDAGGQAADCETMASSTSAPVDVLLVDGADHGIALLRNHPNVVEAVTSWLHTHLL